MKRSQHRNKKNQPSPHSKSGVIEQQAKVQSAVAAPLQVLQPDLVVEPVTAIALPTPNVIVHDRLLCDFLHAADPHAQQTFLAQLAMVALREAKQHLLSTQEQKIIMMQKNFEAVLQQHLELENQYYALQQQNEKLKAQHSALVKQTKSTSSQKSIREQPVIQPQSKIIQKRNSTSQNEQLVGNSGLLNLQVDAERRLRHQQKRSHR